VRCTDEHATEGCTLVVGYNVELSVGDYTIEKTAASDVASPLCVWHSMWPITLAAAALHWRSAHPPTDCRPPTLRATRSRRRQINKLLLLLWWINNTRLSQPLSQSAILRDLKSLSASLMQFVYAREELSVIENKTAEMSAALEHDPIHG